MMATTHVLAGVLVGTFVATAFPEIGVVAIVAGGLGGLLPDLDLYVGHRKTLHYPVFFPVLTVIATAGVVVIPGVDTAALAIILAAAALHSLMDVFGGGLELRPWEATSDRAVFDHARGRWIAPRRFIPYDGSPADLGLAVAFALPSTMMTAGVVREVVVGLVALSAVYVLLRKPLVSVAEWLVARLPVPILQIVPNRFLTGLHEA